MRCVLTHDTRLARVELLGEVDIVEGTSLRRLVIRIETRSTHARSDNAVAAQAAVVVLQLIRGSAIARVIPVPHSVSQKALQRRPGRCVLSEFSHSLPCSRAATPRELQLPSICIKEVLKIVVSARRDR